MVYAEICNRMPLHQEETHYIKRKLAINMHIFVVSEVSGGSYYISNAESGTEIIRAELFFIW